MADHEDDPVAAAIARAQQTAAIASGKAKAGAVVPLRAGQTSAPHEGPLCVTGLQFLADVTPPDWVVTGLMQKTTLYACTAPTNHGKTAVTLLMAICVATGRAFAGTPVTRGNVLILCGENQDGFRLRMAATMASVSVGESDIKDRIWVVPMAAPIETILAKIQHEAAVMGELQMVLVDTSVSFFSGADENDNVAAYQHAAALRALTLLPGKPAVVANCHPTGSANREGCKPRGGSAFLNEIDTNWYVWADGDTSEFHWVAKKRGPDFDPLFFEYRVKYIEQHGAKIPTVVAEWITEDREHEIRSKRREFENRLLYAMLSAPDGTIRSWALDCGFTASTDGKPLTSKVSRLLERLKEVQLVAHNRRDGWHLTNKGKEEAKTIR